MSVSINSSLFDTRGCLEGLEPLLDQIFAGVSSQTDGGAMRNSDQDNGSSQTPLQALPVVANPANAPGVVNSANAPGMVNSANAPGVVNPASAPGMVNLANAPEVVNSAKKAKSLKAVRARAYVQELKTPSPDVPFPAADNFGVDRGADWFQELLRRQLNYAMTELKASQYECRWLELKVASRDDQLQYVPELFSKALLLATFQSENEELKRENEMLR